MSVLADHGPAGPEGWAPRSCLFVPGDDARKVRKAFTTGADQVVVDLEDGVTASRKAVARELIATELAVVSSTARVKVRVNRVGTEWCLDDIIALVGPGSPIVGVVVPGVLGVDHVHFVDYLLAGLEAKTGSARLAIDVLIETAEAATELHAIARSSSRLGALIFGPGDYAASIGMPFGHIGVPDAAFPGVEMQWVMSEIVAHARAAHLQAIDGAYARVHDEVGFRHCAGIARRLGFDGKLCIHPAQVPWANEVFTPSADEYGRAKAVVALGREMAEAGAGVATSNGAMVDGATMRAVERVIVTYEHATRAERSAATPEEGADRAR